MTESGGTARDARRRLADLPRWTIWVGLLAIVAVVTVGIAQTGLLAPVVDQLASGSWPLMRSVAVVAAAAVGWTIVCLIVLRDGYLAILWLLSAFLPGLIATLAVAAYLLMPGPSPDALFIGLVGGLAAWVVLAVPLRSLATVRRAQPRAYGELVQRAAQLCDRLAALEIAEAAHGAHGAAVATTAEPAAAPGEPGESGAAAAPPAAPDPCDPADPCLPRRIALEEARKQLDMANAELEGAGRRGAARRWVTAVGYVNLWRALHRAEEALIDVEPVPSLVGDALHDDLSLENSTIKEHARLRAVVRTAIRSLASPGARQLFEGEQAAGGPGTEEATQTPLTPAEARAAIREVRHAVNDFRDDRVGGLVAARNNVLWTVLFVATTTLLLLSLAIGVGVGKGPVIAVAAFYLVGATVGLFNRLRLEGRSGSPVEDFGLFQARLLHTTVTSGLAAVAGVFLFAAAPVLFAPSGGDTAAAPTLADVFSLSNNRVGLLVAAAFGLTPDLLTRGLQSQASGLERAIRRSEPATEATTSTDESGNA